MLPRRRQTGERRRGRRRSRRPRSLAGRVRRPRCWRCSARRATRPWVARSGCTAAPAVTERLLQRAPIHLVMPPRRQLLVRPEQTARLRGQAGGQWWDTGGLPRDDLPALSQDQSIGALQGRPLGELADYTSIEFTLFNVTREANGTHYYFDDRGGVVHANTNTEASLIDAHWGDAVRAALAIYGAIGVPSRLSSFTISCTAGDASCVRVGRRRLRQDRADRGADAQRAQVRAAAAAPGEGRSAAAAGRPARGAPARAGGAAADDAAAATKPVLPSAVRAGRSVAAAAGGAAAVRAAAAAAAVRPVLGLAAAAVCCRWPRRLRHTSAATSLPSSPSSSTRKKRGWTSI